MTLSVYGMTVPIFTRMLTNLLAIMDKAEANAAERKFDTLVLSNMRLAPDMARSVSPGGSLILSGILKRQRNAVLSAYVGQGFRHVRTLTRGEWVTLHLKR